MTNHAEEFAAALHNILNKDVDAEQTRQARQQVAGDTDDFSTWLQQAMGQTPAQAADETPEPTGPAIPAPDQSQGGHEVPRPTSAIEQFADALHGSFSRGNNDGWEDIRTYRTR